MDSELPTMEEKARRAEMLARIPGGSSVNPDPIFFNKSACGILDALIEELETPRTPYMSARRAYSPA